MLDHLQTIISVLLPMFVGFCIRLPAAYLRLTDRLLGYSVYLILLLIGISIAQIDNLWHRLGNIAFYAALLFGLLLLCNIAALMWFDRRYPWHTAAPNSRKRSLWQSSGLQQPLAVLVGIALGWLLPDSLLPHRDAGHYALIIMIFLVGLQLRGSGIPLKQVLLNKRGLQLSAVFAISCAAAGLLFALMVPQVSWSKGLALSSGYGWYSLSGIIITQTYGAEWGGIALLNDLMREMFSLAFIPVMMRRLPYTAIACGGATSMDLMLPVIQHAGGNTAVPVAVSFGFVCNLLSPLLMVLFSAW